MPRPYRLSRRRRVRLFGQAADQFFNSVEWLASPTGVAGLGLQVGAALTRLLIDQATARFEAVVDAPIGVMAAGYDVPGPSAVRRWFADPDPPELADQFAPEILGDEWQRLQDIHAIVHEVEVLKRPVLRQIFAKELAENDWRAIVQRYPEAVAQVRALTGNAKVRSALKDWWSLLSGGGPERTDAEARAKLEAHWRGIRDLILEELT